MGLPRTSLASGLSISRIVTGLWQIADQERRSPSFDLDAAGRALVDFIEDGFDTIDMADHYGSAEIVAGKARALAAGHPPILMTKWCPEPGPISEADARTAVMRSMDRMAIDRIDLLQLHWWRYQHEGYLAAFDALMALKSEGLIGALGVTNFDAAHLRLLAGNGVELATNQVCFSLLDRRANGRMAEICAEFGIKVLAFGTLAGGFLSEKWLGRPEPVRIADWSKMKYKRFIDVAGGWAPFQELLRVLTRIARKHGVSVANVATGWVLDQPQVAAVIIGARLGERDHRPDNLRMLDLHLDEQDHAELDAALAALQPIPGDCGDEYRKPPFLTASGDLSHHLQTIPRMYGSQAMPDRPARQRVATGSVWEDIAGFSRAVRVGNRILVSGTTATDANGACVCPGDVEGQTVFILDKIAASLEPLGAGLEDIVRTRIFLTDRNRWEEASRAHGSVLGRVRPANSLVEVSGLVGPYDVEIEAEAEVEG